MQKMTVFIGLVCASIFVLAFSLTREPTDMLSERQMSEIFGSDVTLPNCGMCGLNDNTTICNFEYPNANNECDWVGCVTGETASCGEGWKYTGATIKDWFWIHTEPDIDTYSQNGGTSHLCRYMVVCNQGAWLATKSCEKLTEPSNGACVTLTLNSGCSTCTGLGAINTDPREEDSEIDDTCNFYDCVF